MRILSILTDLRLIAVLVFITVAASASTGVVAADQYGAVVKSCKWRGTAPACKGKCEPGEITEEVAQDAESARNVAFGESCFRGYKAFCCTLSCQGGFVLKGKRCVAYKPNPDDYGGGQPKQTDVLTPEQSTGPSPFGAAKPYDPRLKKGGVVAPGPIEGTELNTGGMIVDPEKP
jgi:hypothetical protein